jgi:uncharacterized protein YndB with AHSA1/START domain
MSTTPKLEIETPADEPVIVFRRFVKAPPELVFRAYTEPEFLKHWWGPRFLEMTVCEVDLRVGGTYRFVHRAPDGQEFGFHGEYREIEAPHRLVNTFVFDGAPDHEALDSAVFEAVGGGTMVSGRSVHDSVEARDMHVASGMEQGMNETYERLDEWVAAQQAA